VPRTTAAHPTAQPPNPILTPQTAPPLSPTPTASPSVHPPAPPSAHVIRKPQLSAPAPPLSPRQRQAPAFSAQPHPSAPGQQRAPAQNLNPHPPTPPPPPQRKARFTPQQEANSGSARTATPTAPIALSKVLRWTIPGNNPSARSLTFSPTPSQATPNIPGSGPRAVFHRHRQRSLPTTPCAPPHASPAFSTPLSCTIGEAPLFYLLFL